MSAELQVFDAIAAKLCPGSSGTRLHGALTGAVCAEPAGGGSAEAIAAVLGVTTEPRLLEALRAACAQIESRLGDPELGFTPLLPDDQEPLAQRVHGLAQWCEAFIDGHSSHGDRPSLSAEATELLADISAIAGELEPESLNHGDEEDERDYAEIVEFLRVAALNLFDERATPRGTPGTH